jgi:hypothetical protein
MLRLSDRCGACLKAGVFSLPFILVLAYFYWVDIYDRHFFDAGVAAPYNLFRTLFAIYLFGAICAPGVAALSAIGGANIFARLPPLVRLTVSFFCGAALWHGLLLILGFLDLYVYPVAAGLGVLAVALTPIYLGTTLSELCHGVRIGLRAQPWVVAWVTGVLGGAALVAALLLLVVKGLFPAGGHDYFNHYHGYYEAVLRNHGLWPNDVWFQFFYSKGIGLFFLATLLTDPLAPSIVTYCFAIGTAMALFLLVDRMSPSASFWPWVAVIAYFVFYTFTPGTGVYLTYGGWGDFQKPHEINAAFVVAFLWLCAGMRAASGAERRIWLFAAATCIFILSFVELVSVLILGLFTTVLTAEALIRRCWSEAKSWFSLALTGGCGLAAVLALNYALTGLPSDQFVLEAWPWANVQTLYHWGALPWVMVLMLELTIMRADGAHYWTNWQFFEFYQDILRVDLLKPFLFSIPIFLVLLGGATAYRAKRARSEQDSAPLKLLLVFLAVLAVAAAAAGVSQRFSFYHYTSFCLPVVLGFAGCGWLYICPPIGWLSGATRYWLPVILLVAALSQFWLAQGRFLRQVVPSALAFIDGSISIRQAYGAQQGWPGRHPWGGIFSGSIGAWETTGPGARIWSMHPFAYCILPHCRSETFQSFILSPHLLDMLVGSAEETRDILQREGLNYFFYTTEMEVCDVLPLTKPFAPDGIANYLGIKWNDGTSYLLTWLGPGVTRLTPEWVAQYKEAVESAPNCPRFFPLQLMLSLREQMRGGARRGRDLKFPGITQPKGS